MKSFRITTIILSVFIFTTGSIIAAEKTYRTVQNISYYPEKVSGQDKYITERCKLDIYYPEKTTETTVVVWFHGGGLSGGEKELPAALRNKDICVVGVNYRLTPKVQVNDCVNDAAAAVAWVFENIEKYGGDPNRIFVSGHSAGGYLTAMVGLDKSRLGVYGIDANKIAGLVPFSGQMITHFAERNSRGIKDTQPIVDALAPLFHVRADASPMLLITGDRELEMLGRYEENAYMMRMMKVCGHKNSRLLEIQGYGHGMADPAFPLLLEFIKQTKR